MGQQTRIGEIEEILLVLPRQTNDRIHSQAGRLIDALQARAIFDARKIATELAKDLSLFGTSETRSTLSKVSDLLQSEAAFNNCDRLSYLLLDLEQKLNDLRSPASKVSVRPSLDSHRTHVPVDSNYGGELKGVECAPRCCSHESQLG